MKLAPVAVVLFLLCGMLPSSLVDGSLAKMLHRLRCKNNWSCKECYEVKRQGRCHTGYLMGVCYKTCTGCDSYIDKSKYDDCPSIYKKGMCFNKTRNNPYITYAQRCEASCCQAYPLDIPTKTPPYNSQPSKPVAGGFSEWSKWSSCTHKCGLFGKQYRTRTCTNPRPRNGGRNCVGPSSESRGCNRGCCPEPGNWSQWSFWSSCSKTCCSPNGDSGTRKRIRTCTNPSPSCGAGPCVGASQQTKPCMLKIPCDNPTNTPSSPYWSSWGAWGPCSSTCYGGYREKRRQCIGYQGHGKYCDGRLTKFESCNTYIAC